MTKRPSVKTKAEMEAGATRVRTSMAESLVSHLLGEMNSLKFTGFVKQTDPMDKKSLVVTIKYHSDIIHEESFWDFPSDELKAKLEFLR